MGITAKKVCDLLGWQISVGEPFVRHLRASDLKVNLDQFRTLAMPDALKEKITRHNPLRVFPVRARP